MLDLLIPPELGLWTFLALLALSYAASFITVAFGIGGGAFLLAALAALMPPAALIPVHGVVQVGSNAGRFLVFFRHVSWPALPGFAVGSLIGVAIGGAVVVELPADVIRAAVGCFILWVVFAKPPRWLSRWPWLTGGLSSFLTMFFGATGMLVAGYSKSLKLPRHPHVATHAALMTVQHGLKVAMFGALGFAYAHWVATIAAMILAGLAGTWSGRFLLNRITDQRFHQALNIVLTIIALKLIADALL